ncbi:MAG: mannose-1-phosphate guanylyltransferase/mannose-6-phosphate isomerase [Pseudomonadota bacterium]
MKIYPVIMCGGAGTRLWPMSNSRAPKQYLPLVSERTMLQETAARFLIPGDALSLAAPVLICGAGQEALAAKQLEEIGVPPGAVIVEPFGRNTAAVAAVAASHVAAQDPDGIVLLLPADAHMDAPQGFWDGVTAGLPAAEAGELVTLGIKPTGPETGYGYIRQGEPIDEGAHKVDAFVEKPDLKTAKAYLAEGGYFWNAGIFLYRADAMIREFEALAPDILQTCREALGQAAADGVVHRLDAGAFEACRSEPVDVEIMERTTRAAVVGPVSAGWNDIGSWAALADLKLAAEPGEDNALTGDAMAIGSKGCLIQTDGPFVAAIGVEDLIVVATGDAVLVMPKSEAQTVKKIVTALKEQKRKDLL